MSLHCKIEYHRINDISLSWRRDTLAGVGNFTTPASAGRLFFLGKGQRRRASPVASAYPRGVATPGGSRGEGDAVVSCQEADLATVAVADSSHSLLHRLASRKPFFSPHPPPFPPSPFWPLAFLFVSLYLAFRGFELEEFVVTYRVPPLKNQLKKKGLTQFNSTENYGKAKI